MSEIIAPGGLNSIFYLVVFSDKTAFLKLQDVFPECYLYRDKSPRLEPLICLAEDNSCHVGKNCVETLVKRLHALFEEVLPDIDLIVLYYKKLDEAGIGAGVFWRNLQDFRIININLSAWSMVKERGSILQFSPSPDFFLTGNSAPLEEVEVAGESL